jgi:hypothetical protein
MKKSSDPTRLSREAATKQDHYLVSICDNPATGNGFAPYRAFIAIYFANNVTEVDGVE